MNTRHVVGLIGASLLSLVAVDASAGSTDPSNATFSSALVIQVQGGNDGRLDGEMKRRGPGAEQPVLTTLTKNGKQYVVEVHMQSMTEASGYGPWQCSCSSYEMQENGAPVARVNLKQISFDKNGHRLCNHPTIATDGDKILWAFGDDNNSNRPNLYVGVLDEMCNVVAPPVMMNAKKVSEFTPNNSGITINANDNGTPTDTLDNNDGAPKCVYNDNGLFTCSYCSTAGNSTEFAAALGVRLSKTDVTYSVKREWIVPFVSPGRIARPQLERIDGTRTLACAAQGANRPPQDGARCAVLDATTGQSRFSTIIAPSYEDKDGTKHYMNQPSLAKISDTSYALNVIETNAMGRNTNLKGLNLSHLYTMDLAGDSLSTNGHVTGYPAYQTHSTVCAGKFGVGGAPHVAMLSASPSGIGRAAMVFVNYDAPTKTFTPKDDLHTWAVNWYGDSGHLANWYGENPMQQGRDFIQCLGDVPNPGYHVDQGYMSNVKSFFVAAVAGRVPGDYKNSLFLSFVPGEADQQLTPQNPTPADQPPVPTTDNTGNQSNNAPSSSSGCACSTPGTSTDSGTMLGGLALVGLVLGATRRRAKKA